MESNLDYDCCPTDDRQHGHASDHHNVKLGHLHQHKQLDLENRCESGYKSVDEDYSSVTSYGSVCDSDKHASSRIGKISEESETESTIESIDEGIGSINLSTEILSKRASSPSPVAVAEAEDCRKQCERLCEQAYQQDEDGDTHLHTSIIQLLEALSLHLIALATDPDYLSILNHYLQTALHLAVITKQPLLVRKLITAGADIEVRDHWGNTPLHIACKEGESLIVRLILQPITYEETKCNSYKIPHRNIPQNLEARNYEGQVCVHLAAETGNCDVLYDLLSRGANINARDGKSGRTILHYAAESGNEKLVQFLLSQNTLDVNSETYGGLTPIKLARGRSHTTIVKMLRERGADYDSDDSSEEEMDTESISDDFAIAGKPVSIRN